MDRRLTFILLLVLAVLAGAAWWLERPGKEPEPTATPSTAPLWSLTSTDVSGVCVEDTRSKVIVELARQSDGTWSLVQPVAQAADTGTVEMAVSQVSNLSILSDLGTDLRIENFGVDKPDYLITLTAAQETFTLEVGSATVTASGYYVRKQGDARVVVVGSYALDSLLGWIENLPLPATATPLATATDEPTSTPEPSATPGPLTGTPTAAATP